MDEKITDSKGSKRTEGATLGHKIATVLGVVLCIILAPILIVNITLIIKSYTNSDEVPTFGGYVPLIVLTDSMYPDIKSGDLIICRQTDTDSISVGDVIAFYDPESSSSSIVSHRVTEISDEGGEIFFTTKGDANNVEDSEPVPASDVVGVYKTRIPGAGNVAMFMQTTAGLIVCVLIPLMLLIFYDIIRRRLYDKKVQKDKDALLAELSALKNDQSQKTDIPSAEATPQAEYTAEDASGSASDNIDPEKTTL